MANLQIPNLSNPSMDIWPAPQAQQGGWAIPSPGGAIGGAAQKINPSPKRPYGQVQRIAEDQWRCPDGQTFPRAYLAYRHLKELKEKNPTLLSPYKSPRTSTAERRALQQRAFVGASAAHGHGEDAMTASQGQMDAYNQHDDQKRCILDLFGSKLDANALNAETTNYQMCRLWCLNDPYKQGKHPVKENHATETVSLPPPLAHTEESKATDYGKRERASGEAVDKLLQSTPDTSPSVLLKMHKVYAKAVKNWWQTRRAHRIHRFKKARIDVILPNGIQLGPDEATDL